jgi:hypothetical protein
MLLTHVASTDQGDAKGRTHVAVLLWLLLEGFFQQFRTWFQILTQARIESVRIAHSFSDLRD